MAREREVKVTILGEDKGASKALKQVDDAAAKLGPSGKIAENALQGVTSKLTSGLGPASGQAKDALDKIGGSAISSGGMLGTALAGGALVAGAALVKFGLDGVGALVDLAGEVRNFSRASGLGAEDASRMVSILDDLGISSDVGAGAMFKLAKNVADGGTKLKDYGIEVARNKDGTTDLIGTLENVADVYARQPDAAKKAEVAFAAFGKQGQALIPILEKGRDGIQEMFDAVKHGEILSEKDIADARRFELAIDDAGDSFRSLEISGGRALLPYLSTVTEAGSKTLDFIDKAGARGGGVKGLFDDVLTAVVPAAHALKLFGIGNDDAGDKAKGAAAKFDLQAVALEQMGVEVSDAEKAEGKLSDETKKAAAEAQKYRDKIEQMASSVGAGYSLMSGKSAELTDKQRDLARGFDTAKNSADQLKQGLDILVGVHISATRASIDWESKIRATSDALAENGATLDITTEKGRTNSSAILDMVQSALSHIDALQREGASSEVVSAAYGDHVEALRNVMRQAGFTEEQINALLEKYNLLAAAPNVQKTINVDHFDNYYTRQYGAGAVGGDNALGVYALGMEKGPIPGTGEVPILAHGGEWVVTPEQMARLRGSAAGSDGAWTGAGGSGAAIDYDRLAAVARAQGGQSVTVNMTEKADPMHLAREIAWAMG